MKKAFCFVLTTVVLIVGVAMMSGVPSEKISSFPQEETLGKSTVSSKPADTTITFIKSGVPTDFIHIVYTTETGKKYHCRKSCSGLSVAKAIYETPLKDAKAKGLTECLKCY